jgi:hypothetical protein
MNVATAVALGCCALTMRSTILGASAASAGVHGRFAQIK